MKINTKIIIVTTDGEFYETTEPIDFGKDGIIIYDDKSATYICIRYNNVSRTWAKGKKYPCKKRKA